MSRPSIFSENGNNGTEKPDGGASSELGSELGNTGGDNATERPKFSFTDPSSLGTSGNSGDDSSGASGSNTPKRRGRKPGSRNSKGPAQTIPVEGLAAIILQSHAMLAMITKTQEFLLDETEAKMLAQATANVSRHYDVQMAAKTVDWTNLLMVCGTVYGTRLMAVRNRKNTERRANPPAPKANSVKPAVVGEPPADYVPGMEAWGIQ